MEYFIFLADKKFFKLTSVQAKQLRKIVTDFSVEQATAIKNLESVTNHDVKAVEYFLKRELEVLQLSHLKEWIHFGLTSQDVNNTSIPLLWKDALEQEWMPAISNLILHLKNLAKDWKNISLLARTHG